MHRYDLSGAQVSGPLAEWAAGFAPYLTGRGYAGSTVRQHLGLMAELSAWLGEQGFGAGQLLPAVVDRFAQVMGQRRTHLVSALALAPLLGYLRGAGAVPGQGRGPQLVNERTVLLWEYREYLRAERGLAEATIRNYALYAVEFLAGLDDPLEARLAVLTGGQVLGIVSGQVRGHRPPSVSAVMNADRALLRFLYLTARMRRWSMRCWAAVIVAVRSVDATMRCWCC
jgi:hypothetical protein